MLWDSPSSSITKDLLLFLGTGVCSGYHFELPVVNNFWLLVIPLPHDSWGAGAKSAIFPLTLMFSVAWSLEMYVSSLVSALALTHIVHS